MNGTLRPTRIGSAAGHLGSALDATAEPTAEMGADSAQLELGSDRPVWPIRDREAMRRLMRPSFPNRGLHLVNIVRVYPSGLGRGHVSGAGYCSVEV